MLLRIVRMEFRPEALEAFAEVFNRSKQLIRAQAGCTELRLYRDANKSNVLYTYSHWCTAEDLENYRQSELFKTTWAATKVLFDAPPQAFSLTLEEAIPLDLKTPLPNEFA
jgi:quinol monooxygenase YgiN